MELTILPAVSPMAHVWFAVLGFKLSTTNGVRFVDLYVYSSSVVHWANFNDRKT